MMNENQLIVLIKTLIRISVRKTLQGFTEIVIHGVLFPYYEKKLYLWQSIFKYKIAGEIQAKVLHN